MNNSQKQAIARLRRHIESHEIRDSQVEKYGTAIHSWEEQPTDYGTVWVRFQVEHLGLPETNALRVLDHDYWLVDIGKRGKITLHMGPDSLKQFKGKTFCGMHVSDLY